MSAARVGSIGVAIWTVGFVGCNAILGNEPASDFFLATDGGTDATAPDGMASDSGGDARSPLHGSDGLPEWSSL
jgi:hypothetical protein